MWKRFAAMLTATVLLFGGVLWYYGTYGTRTDSVFYDAVGIKSDAWVMKVDGKKVTAQEYFFWLDSVTEYLVSYAGGNVDFDAMLTDTLTVGQYAKADAANTAMTYAVVRSLAEAQGIGLTEEDEKALDAQRAQYVAYYGGEEAYTLQMEVMGVTGEMFRAIEEVRYLYQRLYTAYADPAGVLYPGAEALQTYGDTQGYVTAQVLVFPTTLLEETAVADMEAKAEEYAEELREAGDKAATYKALAESLGLKAEEKGYTFVGGDGNDTLYRAVQKLSVGEVSAVEEMDGGYFVAMRIETDYASLAEELFNIDLQNRQESAKVEYNERLFERIDAGDFYEKLYEQRLELLQSQLGA